MKHRGALRKRIVRVALEDPAPAPGTPVLDGELPVGTLGSAAGGAALALLRLDRVEEAGRAERDLTAEGRPVTIVSGSAFDFAGDVGAREVL
jgi:folate-binding Fe-S cluster repair protein YgfZ